MTLAYAFVFNHIGKDISQIQKVFIKHTNKNPDKLDWTATNVAIHALPKRSPVSNREEICNHSITGLVRDGSCKRISAAIVFPNLQS